MMKILSENNTFLKYTALIISWGLVLFALSFAAWTVCCTETGNGDNVEHLHSTWLVGLGKVPYRDFFQHHNPLMWYIFAPIVKHFSSVIKLLDFAHAAGITGGVLMLVYIYKICRRFYGVSVVTALTSLLIMCPPYYYIFCFNFNPDTFMATAFAMGIYYLFAYFEKAKLSSLCIAFIAFFAAFMFTQKILIALGFLGLISLYMFYKKKTPIEHLFYALLLPVWCLVLFLVLLYNSGTLETYWKSNYLFNVVMQKYYGNNRVNVADYHVMIFSVALAVISVLCCFKKGNEYFRIIAILFILELPQRCFYFSIAPYYLLPLIIYIGCLNSVLIEKITKKYFVLIFVFLAVCCYYAYMSKTRYLSVRGQDRTFARFIAHNTTPCDYVLGSYMGSQSIMTKDPHYYWAILGHVDMAGEETGVARHPNVSYLVEKYLPKIIFTGVYWSSYDQNRGKSVAIQQVDPKLVDKYYLPTRFPEFYMLKYEYRHKNCRYDDKKGEWLYAD